MARTSMNGPLISNPAWVGQALADTYEWLQEVVPPEWLPILASVKSDPRGSIIGEVHEYGCGAYGCVIPTLDPKIVMKLTADDTEAEFAANISRTLVSRVCVRYPMVVETHLKDPQGAPIYFLWRDAAEHVGKVGKILGRRALEYIKAQHEAGDAAYQAIFHQRPGIGRLLTAWAESCEAMARQTEVPELRPLGEGLVEVWGQQSLLMGDIHTGNVGLVDGLWVVTDPGHIAVVDRELVQNPSADHVADIVNDAARKVAVGPGRGHAYLSEVWDQIKREGKDSGLSFDQFKCEVIRLYNDSLVGLERAKDGRSKVAKASELRIDADVFHLVHVETVSAPAPRVSYVPLTDAEFAERVNAIATEIGPEGRFGDRKVFISEVWEVASEDPRISRMGIDAFKQRLVDSRGAIQLARADLVAAMDPVQVAHSETSHDRATYHFVVDPRFGNLPSSKVSTAAPAHRSDEGVLQAVNDAIPQIGPEGRFGPPKVFISEIWNEIQHEPALQGWTLDRFKAWLLTANRDGKLALARADLVGAMNSKQVAASEIRDRGATFHFVLDPDASY